MSNADLQRVASVFDVARLAGVSHETVAQVVNNLPTVPAATQERVRKAIEQLDYDPSQASRALVVRRSRLIGLVGSNSADFGPSSILLSFSHAAREAQYGVVTVTTGDAHAGSILPFVESLLTQRVEAIVVILADVAVIEAIRAIQLGVPVIIVTAAQVPGFRTAYIDQYQGARLAVRHLIDLGHRNIAHVAGPSSWPDTIERIRGWRDEMDAAGLATVEPQHGDWTARSGFELASHIPKSATGVFVANDQMALGVVSGFGERGVSVPGDVSVVGFDNIPESAFYSPPLSTVRQDFAALGELTMRRVRSALNSPNSVSDNTPIPMTFIERGSTGAPRYE